MIDIRFRRIEKWPGTRTPSYRRRRAQFRSTYSKTLDQLEVELKHLRARDIVIQAGFGLDQIRNVGWPRSSARPHSDTGVIVSFRTPQGELSFPCDRYQDWEDNLRAITLSHAALRAVDRYGVTQHAEQYRGWQALPAPAPSNAMTRDIAATVLANYSMFTPGEVMTDSAKREEAYRQAAKRAHPDAGGSHEAFVLVQQAKRALEQN
jgi:hypothetical protein